MILRLAAGCIVVEVDGVLAPAPAGGHNRERSSQDPTGSRFGSHLVPSFQALTW